MMPLNFRTARVVRLVPVLAFCLAWPAVAQFDRASIGGTVTDSSGAAVPNASVEAVSAETGLRRMASTGPWRLPRLPDMEASSERDFDPIIAICQR